MQEYAKIYIEVLSYQKRNDKMKIKTCGLTKRCTLYLTLGYLVSFLIYYLSNHIFYDVAILSYSWLFLQRLTYLLMIFIAATVTLIFYSLDEKKKAYISLIPFSLVRAVYFIPYFYLIFIYDGFDSFEAILFGLLAALGDAAISYLLTFLVFKIMLAVVKKANKTNLTLTEIIMKTTTLNFSDPVSLAFTVVSLIGFSYFFIKETIDTVIFICDYSGSLMAGEILYIIFSYIFDLALIFIYYFTLSYIKNRIVASYD